jgi:hypothetical protein
MSYRYHNPELQGDSEGNSNSLIAAFFAAVPKNAAPTLPPLKAENRYLRAYVLILAQYAALRLAPLALIAVDKQGQYQSLCRRIWAAPAPFSENEVSNIFDLLDEARTEMMGYRHSKAAQAEDAIDSAQAFLDSAYLAYSGDDEDFEIRASDLELFKSAVKSTLAAGVSPLDVRRYLQKAADALSSAEPAPNRASNPLYKPKHLKNLMLLSRVAKDQGLIPRTQNPKIGVPAAEARLHAALYEFENASDSERNIRAKAVESAKAKYEKEIGYRSKKRTDYAAANAEIHHSESVEHDDLLDRDDNPSVRGAWDATKHHVGRFKEAAVSAFNAERPARKSKTRSEYVVLDNGGDTDYPRYAVIYLSPRVVLGKKMYQAMFLDEKPMRRIVPFSEMPTKPAIPKKKDYAAQTHMALIPEKDFLRIERYDFDDFGTLTTINDLRPKPQKLAKEFVEDMREIFEDEAPRTPNHHRTGLIGDDYPIDPYKHGQFTDDPYNRYWTEGSAQYSGSGALQYVGRKTNGDELLPEHLKLKKRLWEKVGDFVRAFDCKASKARDRFVDGFEGNAFIAQSFRSLQHKMDRVKREYEILSAIPSNDIKKILVAKNKLLSTIASLASFAGYDVEPPRLPDSEYASSSKPDFSAIPRKLSELDDLYKEYARSAKSAHTIF